MASAHSGWRIGVDLDNTLIDYDTLLIEAAMERELVPADFSGTKREVRDAIRSSHDDGELDWQDLQAYIYGPGIAGARLAAGARDFIATARKRGVGLAIVSHKTAYAARGSGQINLRDAARGWLSDNGVIGPDAVPEDALFFEDTRAEKIARIVCLGCTHFVDDLVEVFSDETFPANIERLLFSPAGTQPGPWHSYRTFEDITRELFGG